MSRDCFFHGYGYTGVDCMGLVCITRRNCLCSAYWEKNGLVSFIADLVLKLGGDLVRLATWPTIYPPTTPGVRVHNPWVVSFRRVLRHSKSPEYESLLSVLSNILKGRGEYLDLQAISFEKISCCLYMWLFSLNLGIHSHFFIFGWAWPLLDLGQGLLLVGGRWWDFYNG